MNYLTCCIMALLLPFSVNASQIFLAKAKDNVLQVTAITSDIGYHNQPLIAANGVYFTGEAGLGKNMQTDLFFYDFQSQQTRNLTNSSVSEFSPTLYPYDAGLSSVVVESDGTQRLWFYPFDTSKKPKRLYDDLKPVGYHAWGAQDDMILFMLGEPHYLYYSDRASTHRQKMADDIGRSLSYNAAARTFSFTVNADSQQWFTTLDDENKQVHRRFVLPEQVQDYTWVDENHIAYAIGAKVFRRNISNPTEIQPWYDFAEYCGQISRMNYLNETLAFVCEQRSNEQ
ncbi:hypothetical protein NI389_08925 [Pseudoalteromonas xiamenensis]|uniref:hypothetical protein n=1 Tax=Pseudoalteromonas xiamenensis TaxID=882626 RepID=UPI0027E592CF|nr:hypothetical protein [Pseudoalteromonas xiamenensis]WMN58396.1 hypothetical protein NI389_08925 [Pseudoalteromonas xiamenensis]